MTTRRRHTPEFKAQVAMEAMKEHKSINELGSEYGVSPTQISQWKTTLRCDAKSVFSSKSKKNEKAYDAETARLYEEIGRLKIELDWLKKKSDSRAKC